MPTQADEACGKLTPREAFTSLNLPASSRLHYHSTGFCEISSRWDTFLSYLALNKHISRLTKVAQGFPHKLFKILLATLLKIVWIIVPAV